MVLLPETIIMRYFTDLLLQCTVHFYPFPQNHQVFRDNVVFTQIYSRMLCWAIINVILQKKNIQIISATVEQWNIHSHDEIVMINRNTYDKSEYRIKYSWSFHIRTYKTSAFIRWYPLGNKTMHSRPTESLKAKCVVKVEVIAFLNELLHLRHPASFWRIEASWNSSKLPLVTKNLFHKLESSCQILA